MKHLVDLCCSQRWIFLNPLKHGRWPVRVGDGPPVYGVPCAKLTSRNSRCETCAITSKWFCLDTGLAVPLLTIFISWIYHLTSPAPRRRKYVEMHFPVQWFVLRSLCLIQTYIPNHVFIPIHVLSKGMMAAKAMQLLLCRTLLLVRQLQWFQGLSNKSSSLSLIKPRSQGNHTNCGRVDLWLNVMLNFYSKSLIVLVSRACFKFRRLVGRWTNLVYWASQVRLKMKVLLRNSLMTHLLMIFLLLEWFTLGILTSKKRSMLYWMRWVIQIFDPPGGTSTWSSVAAITCEKAHVEACDKACAKACGWSGCFGSTWF